MAFKIKDFLIGTGLIIAGLVTGQGWLTAIGLGFWQRTLNVGRDAQQRQDGVLTQSVSTDNAVPIVYGTARVAPRIVWADTYGMEGGFGNEILDIVGCFCLGNRVPQAGEEEDPDNGQIEGFGSVFYEDLLVFEADAPVADPEDVPQQPDPAVDLTMTGVGALGGIPFAADFLHTEANRHFGAHDQDADLYMVAVNGTSAPSFREGGVPTDFPWTSAHQLQGTANMVFRILFDPGFVSSPPNVSCVIKGRRLYDPRIGSSSSGNPWAWTNNWALCVRDYLLDQRSGGALTLAEISEASFSAEADVSDELVEDLLGASASMVRYMLDGAVDTGQPVLQNIQEMLAVAGGLLCYEAGVFHLRRFDTESDLHPLELTEALMIGDWTLQTSDPGDRVNRMIVQYVDGSAYDAAAPLDRMEPVEFPATGASNPYLTEDGDYEIPREISLRLVRDASHAYLRGGEELTRARSDITVTVLAKEEAVRYAVTDRILATHRDLQMEDKQFWITAVGQNFDDTVSLGLRAIDTEGLPSSGGVTPGLSSFCDQIHGALLDPPSGTSGAAYFLSITWPSPPADTAERFNWMIRVAVSSTLPVPDSGTLHEDGDKPVVVSLHGTQMGGDDCSRWLCGGSHAAQVSTRYVKTRYEWDETDGHKVGAWGAVESLSVPGGFTENPDFSDGYCLP